MSFTTLPTMQCKAVDISITAEVKMRGEQLNVSPKVFLFFYLFPQLQVPLSLNLFCPKRENETVLCVDGESFTVTNCCRGFRNHVAVPLCLCAGKGNCSRNRLTTEWKEKSRMACWALWWEERERKGEKLQELYDMKYLKCDNLWHIDEWGDSWFPVSCEILMNEF